MAGSVHASSNAMTRRPGRDRTRTVFCLSVCFRSVIQRAPDAGMDEKEAKEMRIVSTFPSGTEIVAALGLASQLVGVSHRCNWPVDVQSLPKVTRSMVEGLQDPEEISRVIRERRGQGLPIYELDEELLTKLEPNFIIGQDVCTVCALPSEDAESAAIRLGHPADAVSLEARRLSDILRNIRRVADVLGVSERGQALVADIEQRLDNIAAAVSLYRRPRVFAVEWMDPLKSSGAWMPDLIEAAGGSSMITHAGDRVREVDWGELVEAAPEVLLVMPCGWSLEKTEANMDRLVQHPAWNELPAVSSGRVYMVDGRICSKHGPRIADGVELLARLIHPEAFSPNGKKTSAPLVDPQLARHWRGPDGVDGVTV